MLTLEQVSLFAGRRALVEDVSLSIRPGEVVAVIGANGAGKSTTLKIASGVLHPARGRVVLEGRSLQSWKPRELAQFTAVMHQHTPLSLPFSVKEVVMMGRYPHFRGAPSATDHAVVAAAIQKAGIRWLAEANYLDLSGGEQQRVHLARVFAQVWKGGGRNRYLFLDEPSNNLDIRYQHSVLATAQAFAAEGAAVLTVLHDLNLAMQYADKILLLKRGVQLAFGTPQLVLQEALLSKAYEFPVRVLRHDDCLHPIVVPSPDAMPATRTGLLSSLLS